jgi:hypothetical protein
LVPFLSYTAVPSTLSEAIKSPVSFVAVPDMILSYPVFTMCCRFSNGSATASIGGAVTM